MSRKDYIAIAAAFKYEWDRADEYAKHHLSDLMEKIAGVMASDNPNFDRSRFLTACKGK